MAAIRSRPQPAIGSAKWIQDENAQVSSFCRQEAEDFAFSARNEAEWLNEHMADIFRKDQINVADVFKTPGKLKGRTPRTTRKHNPTGAREPLSDIFSTKARSSLQRSPLRAPSKAKSPAKSPSFKVAEDPPAAGLEAKDRAGIKDSGYHGLSEDDMDVDDHPSLLAIEPPPATSRLSLSPLTQKDTTTLTSEDRSTTERSFHSAREELTRKNVIPTEGIQSHGYDSLSIDQNIDRKGSDQVEADEMEAEDLEKENADNVDVEGSRSSSQESTPARGLVRKSSLTFAALPAREPITTKKSIGTRLSQTNYHEQHKSANFQSSLIERLTGGKSLGGLKQPEAQEERLEDDNTSSRQLISREESDSDARMTKLHNKSSTQRLHERINLLGKLQPSRPTKSIPTIGNLMQLESSDLPKEDNQIRKTAAASTKTDQSNKEDEEDDWIQPPLQRGSKPTRPPFTKSVSADIIEGYNVNRNREHSQAEVPNVQALHPSEERGGPIPEPISKHVKGVSKFDSLMTNREEPQHLLGESTIALNGQASSQGLSSTPTRVHVQGQHTDEPLNASKSKLQSIVKSARGLFSSSASASAQAKIAVTSPSLKSQREPQEMVPDHKLLSSSAETGRDTGHEPPQARVAVCMPEPRKTRSSTEKEAREKEKEASARQIAEMDIEQAQQLKLNTQTDVQADRKTQDPQPTAGNVKRQSLRKTQPRDNLGENEPPIADSGASNTQNQGRPSQIYRNKDVRRPTKPGKEATNQPKAPPVNIRIGMPSRRLPLNNTNLSSNLQESLHPPSKAPAISKKASNASMQSNASGPKMSAPAGKPKALIAAERKKEQDEREAQRKLEQKREIERKRAAQQEEARRQEQTQRQEAEKQREKERAVTAEDPKKLAQKQAIEKRRMEMQRKEQRIANKAGNENSHGATHREQVGSTQRPDLGGNRPPSRQANVPERQKGPMIHHQTNPAKAPIKRVFDPETDSAPVRPAKPQVGQTYQQTESKRRRTEDEDLEEFPMRPTMAPPIRQSGIRKDGLKPSIFSHSNYNTGPPPASHHAHANSLLKSTTTSQAYQQHPYQGQQPRQAVQADTFRYRDGNKIPFAENPNPPHHMQQASNQQFKTPLPSKLANPSRHQSPHYPNGENIQLQEIPTDSEDSDSSPDTAQKRQRAASLPEWVQSPYLNNLLRSQEEFMDPDAVFGPVGSPHLEEMFRERAHKFRPRTSSANWAGQDRLTQEEIRRDAEARARIRKEGGWSYGGAT